MNQSDELRGAIAKARLEEAQWWERLVDEEHHDEFLAEGEACIYCEHIAELKAAARQAAESPGRAGWQMSQQIAADERSLAEVSADGIVEACAVIAERNHTTAFIPRDIRALKGTFSLRASGYAAAHCKVCGKSDNLHRGGGEAIDGSHRFVSQAAAPTLSEAGAKCFAVTYSNYNPIEVDSLWATREGAESRRKELSERDPWEIIEMEIRKPEAGAK